MNSPQDDHSNDRASRARGPNQMILILLVVAVLVVVLLMMQRSQFDVIEYSEFLQFIEQDRVASVELGEQEGFGKFKDPPPQKAKESEEGEAGTEPERLKEQFRVTLPPDSQSRGALEQLLRKQGVRFKHKRSDNTLLMFYILALAVPLVLFLFLWFSLRRTRDQMMGGGFLSGFGRSPAKRYEASKQPITFNEVAGLEGVKADLQEIVDYLKDAEKFQRLGGRVPKGVLLNGPPGTGKTLLARAIAGEADVPFFSVNGSEFIQMFVGVGASRVRDLFKTAKDNAPAIIFIDEIDAIGRQRGAGVGGGHDEREQTLNQILSEMDGFTQTDSVIVIGATNRPDVLDPALLRPGRFDRHVTVGRPTHRGRVEIFKVHVRDVPLASDVDLDVLASSTVGLTGADIRNLVNEAALWAARGDKKQVSMSDFDYARDKVLMGAKREEIIHQDEKEKTAYHEAGHTILAWFLKGGQRVYKVTIIPRGRTLGSTQTMPEEDRLSISESELRDQMTVLMGGRAAEKMIYDETTVGAENDLERATNLARRMVTHWGMSKVLGPVSYKTADEDPFLGREIHKQQHFSDRTMELIDEETANVLKEADEQASVLLRQYADELERLTRALLKDEELDGKEIEKIIGPSVHHRPSEKTVVGDAKMAAKDSLSNSDL